MNKISMQQKITKMVNASNAAQRKAAFSISCEEASSLTYESAQELGKHVDVLLFDQDVCQSQYTGDYFIDYVASGR